MNKGQYWILNVLVERGCAIHLIDSDNVDQHFSPGHGLDRQELVDTLDSLFQRGDLSAERLIDGSDEDFSPTRSEIATALLSKVSNVTIFLTPQGGALWEEFSAPNWDHYIREEWGEDDWWGASAVECHLAERFLDTPQVQSRIVPGTMMWDKPSPWEATYWKTLPAGCRVRFRLVPAEDECNPWPEPDANWYFNYFGG